MKKDGVKRRKRERSDHLMQHRLTSKKKRRSLSHQSRDGKSHEGKSRREATGSDDPGLEVKTIISFQGPVFSGTGHWAIRNKR